MFKQMTKRPTPDPIVKGQESVWKYPRPPALERTSKLIQVYYAGALIAETRDAWRVLETSHPPVYYLPRRDIEMSYLDPISSASGCEWKGSAQYFDVRVGEDHAAQAVWTYPRPTDRFAPLEDHFAFYAQKMERCLVDGEVVRPQPGTFYGGWITQEVVGPFKGGPGSFGW